MWRRIINKSSINHAYIDVDRPPISDALGQIATFETVQELDISNCPSLPLDSAMDCFCKAFPSLRTLRAAYNLNFKTKTLCKLVEKFPLLNNIDLTVDTKPVGPDQVSILSSSSILMPLRSTASSTIYSYDSTASLSFTSWPLLSNITELTLEGRTDITDSDLLNIAEVSHSLKYFNMNGCISVTDLGISLMILKCKMLQSVLSCDTSFGDKSMLALCSGISSETQQSGIHSRLKAYKLLNFHVGGCRGINGKILSELMSGADYLRSLCLRELQHIDDALYKFSGSLLEMLDVSETKVSCPALCHLIRRNPNLKSLKIRGCRYLLQHEIEETEFCNLSHSPEELYSELGATCRFEAIELGWGFSFFSLGALKPAMRTLRTIVVGVGGSLGPDGLNLLPTICPLLESLILYFQVISDSVISNIIKGLSCLHVLALCYCFGEISSSSFKSRMPNLRHLKLERVAPWMTNEELATLAENCANLVKLSLVGCTKLDSESQAIISSGWPGLTSLNLEECGEITAEGVESLLNCHALEDLTLRHTVSALPCFSDNGSIASQAVWSSDLETHC